MRTFSVNGTERALPAEASCDFTSLLSYIRKTFVTDQSWISSIQVNGNEITGMDENSLAQVPLAEVDTVKVFTNHPREIVQDTLQNLLEFTPHLERYSLKTAEAFGSPEAAQDFIKLVDGISTFTESVSGARNILRLAGNQELNILEADLLSILKDMLDAYQKPDPAYLKDLLTEHFPANMRDWRERGLPLMIRARDC